MPKPFFDPNQNEAKDEESVDSLESGSESDGKGSIETKLKNSCVIVSPDRG